MSTSFQQGSAEPADAIAHLPRSSDVADVRRRNRLDLVHDLCLPTLFFMALGAMTWAIRGCSGFGGAIGCTFAGVTWGAAWWFVANDGSPRRYTTAWIVPALTFGIGISGARGWMQWPHFFQGKLFTNYEIGASVPISRFYGFLWLFIAGVPWAGLGACLLAWCGSLRETRLWHWTLRIACGVGGALLMRQLFHSFPQFFLPLYDSLEAQYRDTQANPSLLRLINDCRTALVHLGFYLGFLLYETGRRDWKNVVLILTVGLINGAGWAICQNWSWAPRLWPDGHFNWWRCWESCGGISIGLAYGIAYFLVNRQISQREAATIAAQRYIAIPSFEWLLLFLGLTAFLSLLLRPLTGGWGGLYFGTVVVGVTAYYVRNSANGANTGSRLQWPYVVACGIAVALCAGLYLELTFANRAIYFAGTIAIGMAWYAVMRPTTAGAPPRLNPDGGDPSIERLGLHLGLLAGLGISIVYGMKGWFRIYKVDKEHTEQYWLGVLWQRFGPALLVCLVLLLCLAVFQIAPRRSSVSHSRRAYGVIWLVLIVQNTIAQLVTGPLTQWNEVAFSIYYVLLFLITAVIVVHFHAMRRRLQLDADVLFLSEKAEPAN
jgi:hypothetical protein